MTKLRYGLVGGGMMGQEHIRNIQLLDKTEISIIAEPDAEMAKGCLALAPNAVIVNDLETLLKRGGFDVLVIASPNYQHMDQLEEIARHVTVPILVEKPLFTKPEDLARIRHLESTYKAPIWVAMEYRYMPPIAKFVERVHEVTGRLRMLSIREHRFPFLEKVGDWNRFNANTGGTLVEKCCHHFDLMRHVMQSEPVRVMASAAQDENHLDESYDGKPSDIWDNAYVIVDFANGGRAMLDLCMFAEGSRYQEEVVAVGPHGKIESFVPGPGRFWNSDLGPAPVPKVIESPRNPSGPKEIDIPVDPTLLEAGDHNGSTFYQHKKFQQIALHGGTPEVSLNDGAIAVAIGLAAQESARTGMAVSL